MRWRKPTILLLGAASVALIGLAEARLDEDLSISLLYVFPVAAAAWVGGGVVGGLYAAMVALSWTVVVPDPHPLHEAWNILARTGFFLAVALPMARLSTMYEAERRLARTDPLTGLANRRAFVAALQEALVDARRPITVVYLDVDDFKSVNDRFGHPGGDQLLMDLADVLRRECRGTDLPARLGGDEFGLLLTGVPDGQVLAIVDRVLEAARRSTFASTLSAGAFTVDETGRSAEAVLASADRLMYAVKRTGKGRVVMRAA